MTTIEPITNLIIAIYGAEKTAKSSIALSAPKPMVDFDFDQSFDRAAARLLQKEPSLNIVRVGPNRPIKAITDTVLESGDLIVRDYDMPLKIPGQPNEGFIAIWEGQFLPEALMAMANARIKSLVIDTGTIMWLMDHQAHLERVQRATEHKERQNLIQIEYARPNSEARAIIVGARNKHKNLVSVHHVGAKYGTGVVKVRRNGREEEQIQHDIVIGQQPAGFSQTSTMVDVVLRSRVEKKCTRVGCGMYFEDSFTARQQHAHGTVDETLTPTATFELCGYTLEAQGQKIINPDFSSVLTMVNALRLPLPIGGNSG